MKRLISWRLWYMLSVVALCTGLSVPFILLSVWTDGDRRVHCWPTPYWWMVLTLICFTLATVHVFASVCAVLPKLKRLREIKGAQVDVSSKQDCHDS